MSTVPPSENCLTVMLPGLFLFLRKCHSKSDREHLDKNHALLKSFHQPPFGSIDPVFLNTGSLPFSWGAPHAFSINLNKQTFTQINQFKNKKFYTLNINSSQELVHRKKWLIHLQHKLAQFHRAVEEDWRARWAAIRIHPSSKSWRQLRAVITNEDHFVKSVFHGWNINKLSDELYLLFWRI